MDKRAPIRTHGLALTAVITAALLLTALSIVVSAHATPSQPGPKPANVAFMSANDSPPRHTNSDHYAIGYPFGPGETWYVHQGYDTPCPGTHHISDGTDCVGLAGDFRFALDLVKHDINDPDRTGGAPLIAAASGYVSTYFISQDLGWSLKIRLDDEYEIEYDHVMDFPANWGANQWVEKGEPVGRVFDGHPGGINHLHFQVNYNGSSVPLDFGVFDLPDNGPVGSNGEWSGTQLSTPPHWSTNLRVNDVPGVAQPWPGGGPSVAVDSQGNAYAIWVDARNSYTEPWSADIYFSYRPVGGAWGPNERVNDVQGSVIWGWLPPFSWGGGPSIAVDLAGNVYAIWVDSRNFPSLDGADIYFSYRPAGGNWGANVRVNDVLGSAGYYLPEAWSSPAITVDSGGNAYAVWSDIRDIASNGVDLYFSYRSNGGDWAPNTRVNDMPGSVAFGLAPLIAGGGVAVAVDPAGNAHAAWTDIRNFPDRSKADIYSSYRPAGGVWGPNVMVNDSPGSAGDLFLWPGFGALSIATDYSGNAYSLWLDVRDTTTDTYGTDLYFSYRPANGDWGPNTRVNDVPNSVDPCLTNQSIAVDGAGNAYAVWGDNRDGHSNLYARHRPAGGSWEPSNRVNEVIGSAWCPAIAVNGAGSVHVVWSDWRSGGPDVYSSCLYCDRGPGPTPSLAAVPASIPADGTSMSSVTLSSASPSHRVRLISSRGSLDTFSPATGTTDAGGRFVATVRSSTPGTAVITAQDLTTGQTFPTSASITFTPAGGEPPPPPANEGPIAIIGVESRLPLNGVYPLLADPLTGQLFSMLRASDFENTIRVHVNWKGTGPGGARLILNGQSRDVGVGPDGSIRFTLNMAQELRRGTNTLQIVAHNASGGASEPRTWVPLSWTASDWLESFLNVLIDEEIRLGYEDGTPVNVEIWLYVPPKNLLSRSSIPGAGEIGLSGIQGYGKIELPFDTAKETRLKVGARYLSERERRRAAGRERLGLSIFGTELSVGAYALGTGRFQPDGAFHFNAVGGGAEVGIAREWRKSAWVLVTTVLGAPPQVSDFLDGLPYVGEFMQRIAYGYLRAEGKLEGQFEYQIDPTRRFRSLTVIVEPGLEVGGQFDVRAIKIRVYAGGGLEATLLCYSNVEEDALTGTNLFCQGVLNGRAGLFAQAFWFSREFSWEWRHVLWGGGGLQSATAGVREAGITSWHLLGHGYRQPYAVFHKPLAGKLTPFSSKALGLIPQGLTATVAEVLVSNVYTYTEPSLALNPANDNALLVWVHDDVSKPLGQNFDLAYTRWDGSTWSTPARVTDDTYLDGAPQVVWDGSGKGLAVWERLNDPALPITATLDTTTTQKIEIAWAQYDPNSDIWGNPAWLSTNTALDHKPSLARNAAGHVLAVWRQNPAGLLSGDTTNPDRVMFATWDDSGWSTPAVAVTDIPGLVDLAADYGDGAATIAYTRFLTPTGSLTPTLQLFTSTWDGGTWLPPQQLTDDDLGHTNPQVVYDNLNQPLLVWQAGDTLRLRNLTTGGEASLTLDPDLVVDEFRLLHDAADNLAAVFTGQQAGQRDLFVAFYDAAHNAWGRPYRLTNDVHSEGYPAPALDSTGRLLMAYALTQITSEERTTTDPDTGEVITYTLPVEGQTDLYTLSHQFVQDLGMGALTVSDTHPQPGASVSVSATVTNTGALALDGVQVAFYDGDPDAGGALINTATLPGTLAAGYTATLTTTYTVPLAGGQRQLVAVADPQDLIAEADETNNRASLFAFGPDLELAGAGVDYWSGSSVGLIALIRNLGTTASPTTTIAYHWDAITGTLAITDTVSPLAAGEAITLTTPWDYGALAQGSYPLVAVVNEGQGDFAETFTDNNATSLTLEVLPDLAVSPLYLWTGVLPDARVTITATVYNFGSVPAPSTEVAIYVDEALTDTTRIGVISLPALDPGGQAVITAIWDTPTWGERAFYVAVDPGRTVTETTWANNLASVSGASACTALQGDVDCSCTVDVADIQTVADRWRQDAQPPYDLDDDKRVTVVDIQRTAANWLSSCP